MVVDTMVFAYALLRVEGKEDIALAALEAQEQIIVPDSMFAELGNVVWQWVQFRDLSVETGLEVLADAESLVEQVIPHGTLRSLALELAVTAAHPFYDTLFIAAAIHTKTTVITFDQKMAKNFPEQVQLLG